MLGGLIKLRENLKLVNEFGLPLSDQSRQDAEYVLALEYDPVLGRFWENNLFVTIQSVLDKMEGGILEVEGELSSLDVVLSLDEVVGLIDDDFDVETVLDEILSLMVGKMRGEVGEIGGAIFDPIWFELVEKFRIDLLPEMEEKRSVLKKYQSFIDIFNNGSVGLDELRVKFPEFIREADLYKKYVVLIVGLKNFSEQYRVLSSFMSVEVDKIEKLINGVNDEVLLLIEEDEGKGDSTFEDRLGGDIEEEVVLLDDTVESDDVSGNVECEVWSDQELYAEYVGLELENLDNYLKSFLSNPEYTVSLLKLFGAFRCNVERDFHEFEARGEVIRMFLEKVLTYGESDNWSILARRSCREAMIESFEGYELAIGSIVDLLDRLNFESELEAGYVYHPSSIRVPDNIQIDFRQWRKVVRYIGGEINTNGRGRHPEFVVPFDEFTWTQTLPTNFFICRNSRYARIFINELTDFMSLQGIESLTKNDFERLQAAYDSIGVRIEFRP